MYPNFAQYFQSTSTKLAKLIFKFVNFLVTYIWERIWPKSFENWNKALAGWSSGCNPGRSLLHLETVRGGPRAAPEGGGRERGPRSPGRSPTPAALRSPQMDPSYDLFLLTKLFVFLACFSGISTPRSVQPRRPPQRRHLFFSSSSLSWTCLLHKLQHKRESFLIQKSKAYKCLLININWIVKHERVLQSVWHFNSTNKTFIKNVKRWKSYWNRKERILQNTLLIFANRFGRVWLLRALVESRSCWGTAARERDAPAEEGGGEGGGEPPERGEGRQGEGHPKKLFVGGTPREANHRSPCVAEIRKARVIWFWRSAESHSETFLNICLENADGLNA